MKRNSHYATVSEAIEQLRKQGFTTDFNLEENCIVCHPNRFGPDEFEIVDVYRYEGETDPADEATVYAVESRSGLKGVLVTGYGASADPMAEEMLRKLSRKK